MTESLISSLGQQVGSDQSARVRCAATQRSTRIRLRRAASWVSTRSRRLVAASRRSAASVGAIAARGRRTTTLGAELRPGLHDDLRRARRHRREGRAGAIGALGSQRSARGAPYTQDPEAYALYASGQFAWTRQTRNEPAAGDRLLRTGHCTRPELRARLRGSCRQLRCARCLRHACSP